MVAGRDPLNDRILSTGLELPLIRYSDSFRGLGRGNGSAPTSVAVVSFEELSNHLATRSKPDHQLYKP